MNVQLNELRSLLELEDPLKREDLEKRVSNRGKRRIDPLLDVYSSYPRKYSQHIGSSIRGRLPETNSILESL